MTLSPDMTVRGTTRLAPLAAVAAALLLAACGSSASTPVESATDSGNPAGWGTMGVEFTVVNAGLKQMYVWSRDSGDVRTLAPGASTTYQGDEAYLDDVEIATSWKTKDSATHPIDIDGSNPTIGSPSVSVDYSLRGFAEGEIIEWSGRGDGWDWIVKAVREADSEDNKRFRVDVQWSP